MEPVSRRTSRTMTSTISDPTTTDGTRQPTGSMPKTSSPRPISHLPTSGWTIIDGSDFHSPERSPRSIIWLAFSTYSRT